MDRPYIYFIDWMKSLGMFLIVYGHVAGDSIAQLTPPIYAKQLGVAFFIFVIGWGLARESRQRFQIVYNRLFPVFFLGLGFAIVISAIVFVMQRDLNESNYLPFFLGINVLLDHFPANPTTWYIGTYIHVAPALGAGPSQTARSTVDGWHCCGGGNYFSRCNAGYRSPFPHVYDVTELGDSVAAGYVYA